MPPEIFPWERLKERRYDRGPSELGPGPRWHEFPPHHHPFRGRLPGNERPVLWRYHSEESDRRFNDKFIDDEGFHPFGYRIDGRLNRFNRENEGPFVHRDVRGHPWENDMFPNAFGRPHFVSNRRYIDERGSFGKSGHFSENNRMDNGNDQRSLDKKGSFKWRGLREKSSESSLFRENSVRLRNGNKPRNVDDRVPFEKKSLKRRSPDYTVFPKSSNPNDLSEESYETGELPSSPSKLDRASDQCLMDNQEIRPTSVESGEVLNLSGKLIDTCNDHGPVNNVLIFTSPTHLDLAKTQKRHSKDECNKSNGVKDVAKFEKESSLGSIDRKPYKWTRSKLETLDTPLQSPSGDADAVCATSAGSSEEGGERKKARLGWGEGLAKFEKKKVEGPVDDSATNPGLVACISVEEPSHASNDFADTCASAANSSPGAEDKACIKSSNPEYDTAFSIGSPNLVHRHNTDGFQEREFCLENVELVSVANLTSSLTKLFQLEDSAIFESSFVKSTDLNQLLMWRGVALKSLEVTESNIDSLENDLKILKSENDLEEEYSQVRNDKVDTPTSKLVEPLSEVSGVLFSPVSGSLSSDREEEVSDRILASNKATAIKTSEIFDNLLLSNHRNSNVAKTSNASSWKDSPQILDKLAFKKRCERFDERVNALKYGALQHLWEQDLQLSSKKNHKKSKKKLIISMRGPHGSNKKHRSCRSRFSNAGDSSLVPTAKTINCTIKLLSDSLAKHCRNFLKMPAMISGKDRKSRFISNNALVEDPCTVEKERAMINPWTKEEREIFMDRFAVFGKNFSKICLFLDHKTIADCVEFYYKFHKSDDFVNLKKKKADFAHKEKSSYPIYSYLVGSGKRFNRETNAASLDVLGEASEVAANADLALKTCRENISMRMKLREADVSVDERETEAADVLAGICGSIPSEPMSSCVTSSFGLTNQRVDSYYESFSEDSCGEREYNDWTYEERSSFMEAFASFGNDSELISRYVGTKSKDECKVFLCKARGRFGLDQIRIMSSGEDREDGNKNEGSDKEGACVVSSEKSSSNEDKDVLLSDRNMNELDKKDSKDSYKLENMSVDDLIGESNPSIGTEGDLNSENCVDIEPVIVSDPMVVLQGRGNGEGFSSVGSELADVAINIREPQVEEQEMIKENNSGNKIDDNCVNDKEEACIKGLKELNYADQELNTCVTSSNADAGSSDVPVDCGISKLLLDLKPALKESPGNSLVADTCPENGISASRGMSSSSQDDFDRIVQKLYHKSTNVASSQYESHSSLVYFGYPLQVAGKKEFNGDYPFLQKCSGSDTSKRNSDVKLFGQILNSNPENTNPKCPYTINVDPDSVVGKFDENSCVRHENIPSKGFGVWDGNRTTMGFSPLLANYPPVFGNFTSTSTIKQQSTIVKSNNNDINLKGVSVFPSTEMTSGNEIVNYQFSGLLNSLGMVGPNVGLSDPVEAIKIHHPKAENYSSSSMVNKTVVEEE